MRVCGSAYTGSIGDQVGLGIAGLLRHAPDGIADIIGNPNNKSVFFTLLSDLAFMICLF